MYYAHVVTYVCIMYYRFINSLQTCSNYSFFRSTGGIGFYNWPVNPEYVLCRLAVWFGIERGSFNILLPVFFLKKEKYEKKKTIMIHSFPSSFQEKRTGKYRNK